MDENKQQGSNVSNYGEAVLMRTIFTGANALDLDDYCECMPVVIHAMLLALISMLNLQLASTCNEKCIT